MSNTRHALLVVGSGRGKQSNSHALGSYLLAQLHEAGWTTGSELLLPALKHDDGQALAATAGRSELLILAFPLYVDSLPAAVIRFLERLVLVRPDAGAEPSRLAVIVNCGFPGVYHNRLALEVCEQFCRESAWRWAGGLAMGGGEVVNGQDLGSLGWPLRHQRAALERAAADLTGEGRVSEQAIAEMAKPAIPVWFYLWRANQGFQLEAAKHGVGDCLDRRPYEPESSEGQSQTASPPSR